MLRDMDERGPVRDKERLRTDVRERRRAVLLVNARSRQGARNYRRAVRLLRLAGFTLTSAHAVVRPGGLAARLRAILRDAPDLVVVGGGDGTIATAAGLLAHRDTALGVLPLGTTNNFARSLGLPMDLVGAVKVLRDGMVADVDLGEAGGHMFANMLSMGLSVQVAEKVPARLKRVVGRPAYPIAALLALPSHEPFHASITIDGETVEVDTHQLNVANGAYHHGRRIARDATADDGLLTVYRLGDTGRLRVTAASVRHTLRGPRLSQYSEPFLTTGGLRVETDPPMPVSIDGEVRTRTPLDVTVARNALYAMVPEGFPDD
jgi:YegS/Rv2252/BmrU family lipid kinase